MSENETDQARLMRRVKALLELAENNTNEHQAAAAAAKAAQMIAQYNLDIDAARNYQGDPTIGHDYVFLHRYTPDYWKSSPEKRQARRRAANSYRNSYTGYRERDYYPRDWPPKSWYSYGHTDWLIHLANAVAKVCRCKAPYYSPGLVTFIGEADDLKMATFLFSNIFNRLLVMADQAVKGYVERFRRDNAGISPYRLGGYHHPNRYREGWIEAAALEIALKLRDTLKDETIKGAEGEPIKINPYAVVLSNAIDSYMALTFPKVKEMEKTQETRGNAAGYLDGRKAGREFELQKGIDKGEISIAQIGKGK